MPITRVDAFTRERAAQRAQNRYRSPDGRFVEEVGAMVVSELGQLRAALSDEGLVGRHH